MQLNYVPSLAAPMDDDHFSAIMSDGMGQSPTKREMAVQSVLDALCVGLGIRETADADDDQ